MQIANEPAPVLQSPAAAETGSKGKSVVARVVFLIIAAIFAGFTLRQTIHYNVQIPFWDEWDFLSEYQRYEAGEIPLSALILAHEGGHLHGIGPFVAAIGVQEAGWILLWRLTGMNFGIVKVVNWSMAVAFIVLMALVARQALPRGSLAPSIILSTASFFVFNPGAYQLWIWSIPPVYLIGPLLFLAAAYCAQTKLPMNGKILICAAAATIASFTFGAGVLLWALLPFVLAVSIPRRELLEKRAAIATYGLLALLTAGLHVYNLLTYHYPLPAGEGPVTVRAMASFFLAYTGNLVLGFPAEPLISWAHGIGAILLMFLGLSTVAACKSCRAKPEWTAVTIWLCLAGYQLLAGGLVTLARHSLGANYPVEASRYVLSASFLPVATVAIAIIAVRALRCKRPFSLSWYSGLLCSVTAVLAICLVIRAAQTPGMLAAIRQSYKQQLRGSVALAAADLMSLPEYRGVYPHADWEGFRSVGAFVTRRAGLPPMWDNNSILKLASLTTNSTDACGAMDRLALREGRLSIGGWAYLKARQEPADAVIILAVPPAGSSPAKLLAIAFPEAPRLDVATLIGTEAVATGWTADIPTSNAPTGTLIRSFAYDVKSGDFCPLPGDRTL
jgi:hypothetical protein